jgi:chemotaxis methyl-accepting protein methylase
VPVVVINVRITMTEVETQDTENFNLLLEKVFQEGGYDFRNYRTGTISRRLARRLYVTGAGTYPEYMCFLDAHPEEYQKLADDLTIKVSGFFRSQRAFQQLTELVLPELILHKEVIGQRKLRFWSAACACGEEAYSMAMTLAHILGPRRQNYEVTIYATDISQWALDRAQAGIYPSAYFQELPEVLWDSFVTRKGEMYEIIPDIRQMVTFSRYDLTSTVAPPFRELDCIFCCNVLIYWQKQLQERVLKRLYDALDAPGYLVLSEVETPPQSLMEKLTCLDGRAKIYKKVAQ